MLKSKLLPLHNAFLPNIKYFGDKIEIQQCLHYNSDNNNLFASTIEIYNFKADNEGVNFSTQFCLGSINKFTYFESEDAAFKRNSYDFSVDYDAIDKSDKYLMFRNNIK